MPNLNSVYQWADYYDIVFNRDISQHVDFCQTIFREYVGRELRSVLDIACGPGYHAQAFARQGIAASGLDLSSGMLAFGRQQAEAQGLAVDFIEADMRTFKLDAPVDMALCVFDGLDLLTSPEAAIEHLRAVAAALVPGGLYVIEQTHPREASIYHLPRLTWSGERDGIAVTFIWGVNEPQPDIATGVAEIEMEMRIDDHGKQSVIRDRSVERTLTPGELRALLDYTVPDLQIAGYYGAFDIDQPLDWSDGAVNMITVLQRSR